MCSAFFNVFLYLLPCAQVCAIFFLDCTTLVGLTNDSEPRTFSIRISNLPVGSLR
jgi:hypothetical protein